MNFLTNVFFKLYSLLETIRIILIFAYFKKCQKKKCLFETQWDTLTKTYTNTNQRFNSLQINKKFSPAARQRDVKKLKSSYTFVLPTSH